MGRRGDSLRWRHLGLRRVEPRLADPDRPVVSLDMTRMNRLVEVDETSLAARIQAGPAARNWKTSSRHTD